MGQRLPRSSKGRSQVPNKKKKQSTGSYAGHRDQHEGLQKQKKEKKKDNPTWRPKDETVKQRQQRVSQPSFIESLFGLDPKKKGK